MTVLNKVLGQRLISLLCSGLSLGFLYGKTLSRATYSTEEIMNYETEDLCSNPAFISIPFMPLLSGPRFVHYTYLMAY